MYTDVQTYFWSPHAFPFLPETTVSSFTSPQDSWSPSCQACSIRAERQFACPKPRHRNLGQPKVGRNLSHLLRETVSQFRVSSQPLILAITQDRIEEVPLAAIRAGRRCSGAARSIVLEAFDAGGRRQRKARSA